MAVTYGGAMFDPMDVFSRQFAPVEGGYLYYPSPKSGGKLITDDEFSKLASDWKKTFGRRGLWQIVGIMLLVSVLFLFLKRWLDLPDWVDHFALYGNAVALFGWYQWAAFAPRRLVRGRPAIAPPRSVLQARREARAMIKWPFLIVVILACGAVLVGSFSSLDRSWAWIGGSGIALILYLWVAFLKLMDSRK